MGYRMMFLAGVLVGGLAAAGMMLFFAPMSGKKMRARMIAKGMDLQDEALDRAVDMQDTAWKLWRKQNKKLMKNAMKIKGNALDKAGELQGRGQKVLKNRSGRLSSLFGM